MMTVGCAACVAHVVLARTETPKIMHVQKCNWQQNSESLKKQRDRTLNL
ncbi:hypothetical protein [Scytonema millei]|uniref:Uncharacterized protein n=1 Tax=Scytonema millei VB511283 TaxID=1245923 RepID=A0A9X5E2X0_9CYAN|nr:hypothetical protein [Scytonema millei]NHC34191.1 hypothetical protein [Scytonema millei VB511283]